MAENDRSTSGVGSRQPSFAAVAHGYLSLARSREIAGVVIDADREMGERAHNQPHAVLDHVCEEVSQRVAVALGQGALRAWPELRAGYRDLSGACGGRLKRRVCMKTRQRPQCVARCPRRVLGTNPLAPGDRAVSLRTGIAHGRACAMGWDARLPRAPEYGELPCQPLVLASAMGLPAHSAVRSLAMLVVSAKL